MMQRFAIRGVFVTLLALAACLLTPCVAMAQSCPASVDRWVDTCGETLGGRVQATRCPDDIVILSLQTSAGVLNVELTSAERGGFRQIGAMGLSPIGNFQDWQKEPEALRDAFDAVATCADAHPEIAQTLSASAKPSQPSPPPSGSFPVRAVGGALILAVLCASRRRQAARDVARSTAFVGLFVAAFVALHHWLLPTGLIHQNGQGPVWVREALGAHPQAWDYGPGYRELFAGPSSLLSGDPESGLLLAQSLLGAFGTVAAYALARTLGAARPLAVALAAVLALDPVLARLWQSESYLGVGTTFGLLGALALATGAESRRVVSPRFVLGVVAAGLLVAQAARVHPANWPPASLLPLVLLALPGPPRRGLLRALAAAVGVACVVALTTGPALVGVLLGPLGDQWLPVAAAGTAHTGPAVAMAGLAVVSLMFGTRLVRSLAMLLAAGAVHLATHLNPAHTPWIDAATLYLHAPIFVAGLVGALTSLRVVRRHALATATAVALTAVPVWAHDWPTVSTEPTDAREIELARQWRATVPPDAVLFYLGRSGRHTLLLPLYASRPRAVDMAADELAAPSGRAYYYRSSLCSTPKGAPACDSVERSTSLEPLFERALDPVPSLSGLDYDRDPVRVGLYRVTHRAPAGHP